jgi:hypothetical protein
VTGTARGAHVKKTDAPGQSCERWVHSCAFGIDQRIGEREFVEFWAQLGFPGACFFLLVHSQKVISMKAGMAMAVHARILK